MAVVELDRDGAIATVTLNRPDRHNGLDPALRTALSEALDELEADQDIRVVRLRGAGRSFCSGYDIAKYNGPAKADVARTEPAESGVAMDAARLRDLAAWVDRLRRFRKPIVAQVHGYCLSGGLDLIGICDIVISAESARFGHPAGRAIGIPISLGNLPHRIGELKTKELLFTGDLYGAPEVLSWGMLNRVVPDDELDRVVLEYCQRVALMPMDMLVVHKRATNKWFSAMGYHEAVDACVDIDAIAHTSGAYAEFYRQSAQGGLKEALTWRDGPFA